MYNTVNGTPANPVTSRIQMYPAIVYVGGIEHCTTSAWGVEDKLLLL